MINQKTVLILGAGASKPYGLPLGMELRDSVIRAKDNFAIFQRALGIEFSRDEYSEFTTELAHSGFSSVDAFLEENDKWLEIGKAAIALNLLKDEISSKNNLFPPKQPKDHWYEVLWSYLKAPSWALFKKNQISIITFNYDRSIEHYLVTLLSNNYKIKPATAMRGLNNFPLLHVHGHLGNYIANNGKPDFGNKITKERFIAARSGIQIVHENKGDTSEFRKAQKLIKQADRVLLIGFGFHSQNMTKLGLIERNQFNALGGFKVFGTHKGIKAREWGRICHYYGFAHTALKHGAGSISDLLNEWIQ